MEKTMCTQRSRVLVRALCATAVTIVTLGSPQQSAAQAPDNANLIGGWRVTVDPGTADEAFAVLLVNEGGTATVRVLDGDNADGVWIRTARRTFALTLDEFDDVNSDGADERYRIRATIRLLDRNMFTGTLTIDETSLDGSVVLEMEGQSSFEGTRMRVVPE
jgi:hypothetical protein